MVRHQLANNLYKSTDGKLAPKNNKKLTSKEIEVYVKEEVIIEKI